MDQSLFHPCERHPLLMVGSPVPTLGDRRGSCRWAGEWPEPLARGWEWTCWNFCFWALVVPQNTRSGWCLCRQWEIARFWLSLPANCWTWCASPGKFPDQGTGGVSMLRGVVGQRQKQHELSEIHMKKACFITQTFLI